MQEKRKNREKTTPLSIYDVWLDQGSGLSARQKKQLAKRYGSSQRIYEAGAAEVCFDLTGKNLREHPKEALWKRTFQKVLGPAEEQLAQMEKKQIEGICLSAEEYPKLLLQLSDPPWLLYYRGNWSLLEEEGVAVVGARKGTEYGRWVAFELGKRLGRAGITVVSGMAYGVDSCAHSGALSGSRLLEPQEQKSTVAVLGCGVDVCYPRSNSKLFEQIISEGVVVSELPPGTEPKPFFFPMRNRIISGLSRAVVVAEAGLKSGSLITAELAAEQGKDVYAVPGNINRPASAGANKLIQDGAFPVVDMDETLAQMGIFQKTFTENTHVQLGEGELRLYNKILEAGEIRCDQLALELDFPVSQVTAMVTILEMKGILQTTLGKIFIAKS